MKKRNEVLPKSPKTCQEIIDAYNDETVMRKYGTTLQNGEDQDHLTSKSFFKHAHNAKSFSYVVFGSENIIQSIKNQIPVDKRKFLLDATFKVCPYGPFNQLLIIHIEHLNEVTFLSFIYCLIDFMFIIHMQNLFFFQTTPFLFILMSRKTKRAYAHVFKYIRDNLIELEGASIMSDFEIAMRRALKEVFPNTKLMSCWFHFTQAAKKRAMQSPQLIPYLLQCEEARAIYYKLLSLPLLPAHSIVDEFKKLKIIALANHRKYFADFINYYEKQWIKKVRYFFCHAFINFFWNFFFFSK